jgi:hypothetical protein
MYWGKRWGTGINPTSKSDLISTLCGRRLVHPTDSNQRPLPSEGKRGVFFSVIDGSISGGRGLDELNAMRDACGDRADHICWEAGWQDIDHGLRLAQSISREIIKNGEH